LTRKKRKKGPGNRFTYGIFVGCSLRRLKLLRQPTLKIKVIFVDPTNEIFRGGQEFLLKKERETKQASKTSGATVTSFHVTEH